MRMELRPISIGVCGLAWLQFDTFAVRGVRSCPQLPGSPAFSPLQILEIFKI
jgi:hypothetical protein